MRNRWRVRLWALFILSVMLFSMILPGSSIAGEIYSGNKLSVDENSNKINQKLKKEFSKKEYATFIVMMQDQANTSKIAKEAEKQSKKQKLSSVKSLHAKRSAIVSALRTKAIETQQNVKDLLKKERSAKRVKEYESYYIVNALAITGTKETVEKLAKLPEVKSIIPNGVQKLSPIVPNSEKAEVGTHVIMEEDTDPNVEWNISHIGAPKVWEKGIDGTGTVVASIDSGVDWRHPALQTKYRGYNPETPTKGSHEFNWYDPVYKIGEPVDSVGHGTHTMGTIVGQEPDGKNKIGVAPGAKWISVRAFTSDGGEDRHILAAGEWVLAPKDKDGQPHPEMAPDVINNSWGGNPEYNEWFRPMVQAWINAGIVPVFSAGNSSIFTANGPGTISAPGNYPEAIAVGATDSADKIASFSFRGPSPYGEIKPDLTAPGVSIRSSTPRGNYEGGWNGTSMAAPHVSGAVLLLHQLNSQLTVEQLKELLKFTSTPRTDEQYKETPNQAYGHGVLNVEAAVNSVMNGLGEIHGQIKKDGTDLEPPTLEFDEQSTMYLGSEQHLFIHVKDNISVKSVTLKIRQNGEQDWTTIKAKRTSGNHLDGVYEAVIEKDQLTGSKLRYYWMVEDFSGNSNQSNIVKASISEGLTVGYRENFESYPSGWFSYGRHNEWQWGEPTYGPEKAASGTKVYATNLRGTYSTGANMTLQMPPILVPKEGAFMLFKQWYNMSYFDDLGSVLVSTDQKSWKSLAEIKSGKKEWHDQFVDLSNYAGQKIYVAFNLKIEGSVGMEGWYIDDIRLISSGNFTEGLQKTIENANEKENPLSNKTVALSKENLEYPMESQSYTNADESGLPLNASISVVETGRTVTANPENGEYTLLHPKGSYTVKAETYGFASKTQKVTVEKDTRVEANLTLDPLPKGIIQGRITDQKTGKPIEGATVMILEDAAIKPAVTDVNGNYSLGAYEGNYTVYVFAKGYHSYQIAAEVKPENTVETDSALKPFIGTESEISYDDGTAETSFAFPTAGNAWAVKMNVPDRKEAAILGANLRFWNTLWPRPGGTNIEIAIYDSTGKDGMPGNRLAGPIMAEAIRDQNIWTYVDLSDLGVVVDDDFYIVYFQADDHPYAPAIATDKNSVWKGQSYQFLKGDQWYQTPKNEGNYMIRANVSIFNKDAQPPIEDMLTIDSPVDGSKINHETVMVRGKVQMQDLKEVEVNGQRAIINEDGSYEATISLLEGENGIKVIAKDERGRELTNSVKVYVSLNAPVIQNLKPEKDASYMVGQRVKVEFNSKSNLQASFTIQVPGIEDNSLTDLQMEEVKKGYYVGYWTVSPKIVAKGATVEVKAVDDFGNETREVAPGKLFINTKM